MGRADPQLPVVGSRRLCPQKGAWHPGQRADVRSAPHRRGCDSLPGAGAERSGDLTCSGFGGGGEGRQGALPILAKGHTTPTSQLGQSFKMSDPLPLHHPRLVCPDGECSSAGGGCG